jgi:uncharacterized protein (UPF0210 family)
VFISPEEILETIRMIESERLDIRTITMGVSLRDCIAGDLAATQKRIYQKISRSSQNLVKVAEEIQAQFGLPVINKRVSVTAIAFLAESLEIDDYVPLAQTLDEAASAVAVDFIGGFSALVQKSMTPRDRRLILSIPRALSQTERVCSSVNVASTKAGINMDAITLMGRTIKETAELTASRDGIGCAKLVVFANIPEDNPFMAGAYHGQGEGDRVINVGISGPGVIRSVVERYPEASLQEVADIIKRTAFKITRAGELVAREAARRLDCELGIIDLSLAPTPAPGDSVAQIIEAMGIERCGAPGTTAALALLNDAVKKGGAMATSSPGGLSGAFIPISEDAAMAKAVEDGALSMEKLEAMTAVCSVGLDMIAVPGSTSAETISAIIADEMAIGVFNNKTTAARLIPVPGKKPGEKAVFGGLLGEAPIISLTPLRSAGFVGRGGKIPPPLRSLNN